MLQSIALEPSHGEYKDSESDAFNNAIADIQTEEDSSDSDDEYANQEAPTNTDDGVRARSSSDNDKQTLLAKTDPTGGAQLPPKSLQDNCSSTILLKSVQDLHQILHPASYVAVFFLRSASFLNEPMLRNIQKCTTAEAHLAIGKNSWMVTLDEIDKFVGFIVARGVVGGRTLPIKSMWGKSWGYPLFNATMSSWRFLKIMKYLRFHLKTQRSRNLKEEKFC